MKKIILLISCFTILLIGGMELNQITANASSGTWITVHGIEGGKIIVVNFHCCFVQVLFRTYILNYKGGPSVSRILSLLN